MAPRYIYNQNNGVNRAQVVESFLLDLNRDSMGRVTGCNNPKMCGYSPALNRGYATVDKEICPREFCGAYFQVDPNEVDGLMKKLNFK
jgi:hypothetical protein